MALPPRRRSSSSVTDAELSVLEILWRRGPLPIRQIAEALYPGGKTSEYATVQKLLERLEAKCCVERDRSSFVHVVRAVVDRTDLLDQELSEVAEKLCEGSLTPLLLHLATTHRLTPRERQALELLLEKSNAEKNRPGRGARETEKP